MGRREEWEWLEDQEEFFIPFFWRKIKGNLGPIFPHLLFGSSLYFILSPFLPWLKGGNDGSGEEKAFFHFSPACEEGSPLDGAFLTAIHLAGGGVGGVEETAHHWRQNRRVG